MIPKRQIAAAALLAGGLLGGGAVNAAAAPTAPAERISTAEQLQAHLAKAIALDSANSAVGYNSEPSGQKPHSC